VSEESLGRKVACPFCQQHFIVKPPRQARAPRDGAAAAAPPHHAEHAPAPDRAPSQPSPHHGAQLDEDLAARSRFRENVDPTRRIIGIASVSVVGVLILIGVFAVLPKFLSAQVAGGPDELFSKLQLSVKTNNPGLLWALMDGNDQIGSKAEIHRLRAAVVNLPNGAVLSRSNDPAELLIAILSSPDFSINLWKIRRRPADQQTAGIWFDDHTGKQCEMPCTIARGWRLRIAEYCLDRLSQPASPVPETTGQ